VAADSDIRDSLESKPSESSPNVQSGGSDATLPPTESGDVRVVAVDRTRRPSVIKRSERGMDLDGEAGNLEAPTPSQSKHNDDLSKSRALPVKSERAIENKKASRPSLDKRAGSKESVKSKS